MAVAATPADSPTRPCIRPSSPVSVGAAVASRVPSRRTARPDSPEDALIWTVRTANIAKCMQPALLTLQLRRRLESLLCMDLLYNYRKCVAGPAVPLPSEQSQLPYRKINYKTGSA